tara:strand:+ start:2009 stop:2395 length:387 start_codon:yes stop_codon:yes gene_type:complete
MAHFAEIDKNFSVLRVLVLADKDTQDEEGTEIEDIGARYLSSFFGGKWKKTSYNTFGSSHRLQKVPFRKNFAGVGYKYDKNRDAFIPPKPFSSWILNEETCLWNAPEIYPNDGKQYFWNEEFLKWEEI